MLVSEKPLIIINDYGKAGNSVVTAFPAVSQVGTGVLRSSFPSVFCSIKARAIFHTSSG